MTARPSLSCSCSSGSVEAEREAFPHTAAATTTGPSFNLAVSSSPILLIGRTTSAFCGIPPESADRRDDRGGAANLQVPRLRGLTPGNARLAHL